MKEFINLLGREFSSHEDPQTALEQKAYMKNKFEFFGIKTPLRREIQKPFLAKEFLPTKSDAEKIIKVLWNKPQREYHHFSQELIYKYVKQLEEKDIALFEFMILHNSWWDTIDFIAPKLVGAWFKQYPEKRNHYIEKWIASNNIWLQRSAILFQLKDKDQIDTKLLSEVIHSLLGSKEFFINKAIGWILREYTRTNPAWVIDFCQKTKLANLSHREALRLIK